MADGFRSPDSANDDAAPDSKRASSFTPELSALIEKWIDDLPTEGQENVFNQVFQQRRLLPLHQHVATYQWVLRPDGIVLTMEYFKYPWATQVEGDAETVYAALAHGARKYHELLPLLPARPDRMEDCSSCNGVGAITHKEDGRQEPCANCCGLGMWPRGKRLKAPDGILLISLDDIYDR